MLSRRSFIGAAGVSVAMLPLGRAMAVSSLPGADAVSGRQSKLSLDLSQALDLNPAALDESARQRLTDLLLGSQGAMLVTSAQYPRAQRLLARLLPEAGPRPLAVRLWAEDAQGAAAQLERALTWFQVARLDLVQIEAGDHWQAQLAMLQQRRARGEIGTIGLVARHAQQLPSIEAGLSAGIDTIQLPVNPVTALALQPLLVLAQGQGVGVMGAAPFQGGALLRKLADQPLPTWAGEASWDQLLLRFTASQSAIDQVLVNTSDPYHWQANLLAMQAAPLSSAQRREIAALAQA